jgi:Tfp pilus assembly protein PilF
MVSAVTFSSKSEAQTYLPESRYQNNLPSPTLLYPERAESLYPNYSVTAPLPETVEISPNLGPIPIEPITADAQKSLTQESAALPFETITQPTPSLTLVPPSLEASTSATKFRLPPPPKLPQFTTLKTLETTGASKTLPEEALQRQALSPEVSVPFKVTPAKTVELEPIAIIQEPTQQDPLDKETRAVFSKIPGGIDSPRKQSNTPTDLNRFAPNVKGVLNEKPPSDESVARHESMGVAIEVRQPNLNVNIELQNAYDALMGGQPQIARQIYKDILAQLPHHQDALFGVATTYHRAGELELARPYYMQLLKLNPKHRDALTNFLSLVAQEAPEEATAKLETLAKKNPDFSAIPALLGGLYEQMGDPSRAIDSLIRAVRMEPDNLAYKYNLAVLYDKHGSAEDAIVLYNQLLAAGQSGLPLPAPIRDLQERVIYISSRSEG